MSRLLPACGAVIGVMGASLAIVVARSGDNAETTYAGTTWVASAATFVAALALFGALAVARSRTIAALAFAAGVCWLAPARGWLAVQPADNQSHCDDCSGVHARTSCAPGGRLHRAARTPRGASTSSSRRTCGQHSSHRFSSLSYATPSTIHGAGRTATGMPSWSGPRRGLADALVAARPWAGDRARRCGRGARGRPLEAVHRDPTALGPWWYCGRHHRDSACDRAARPLRERIRSTPRCALSTSQQLRPRCSSPSRWQHPGWRLSFGAAQ